MRKEAFTLLELLVTIAVIAVLLTIGFAAGGRMQEKAKRAKCMTQIRSFHSSLSSAVIDRGEWPQLPLQNGEQWDGEKYYQWWSYELGKYGMGREVWVCPSDRGTIQRLRNSTDGDENFHGSYAISNFQPGAKTPFRYNQPWVVERGAYHKTVGGHILMPDGSVETNLNTFFGR